MRTFLRIVLCLSVVNLPIVRGDCLPLFQQVNIDDTTVNKEIFHYTFTDDFEFKSWKVTQADGEVNFDTALTYFDHKEESKNFQVLTTEAFQNLNNDAYTDGANLLTITIAITLTCNGADTSSTLLVQVSNTNQNAPLFSKSSFTYTLPMPIMPKTDFSVYGDEITAKDIDFSTSQITFSVEPNHFEVTSSKMANKTFQAVFSANQILRFTKSQTYTLTATDSGSPPKSTLVQITLNVDPASGLDSPLFSSAYYSYNYTSGDTSLIPNSGEIVIQSDKSSAATYVLSGDYSDKFNVDFKNTTKTFLIAVKSDTSLPEDVTSPIILTLTFTTDVTVSTVILITVVKDESIPVFTSDYYVGTYDIDKNTISWQQPIKVSDANDVKLSGNKANLFTVDSTTFELKAISPLSTSDFDENSNLFLTLIALATSNAEARAPIVISLPTPEELKFNSASYYGSYKVENKKGVVTLDDIIGFDNVANFNKITIAVDSAYSANFQIELKSNKWKVTVIQELDNTTLNANSELAIPITATKTGESTKSTAILVIKLPDKAEIKFDNPYYTAQYVKGSKADLDTVVLDYDIIIDGTDVDEIIVTPEDYSQNFVISYNSVSSKCEITVKSNLNSSILHKETQLIITITAAKSDGSATSSTVLVLKLPEKSLVHFENNHYVAEYIEESESKATVKLTADSVKITGADYDQIEFIFEGYEENFEMKYDLASSSFNITVKKNLDISSLNSEQLIITITAVETGTSSSATTVLVLSLPEKTSTLNFENTYYAADYIENTTTSSQATIKFAADSIKITGANDNEITFKFEGYEDNFKMVYDSASSSFNIIVNTNLDISTLNSKQLIITITAVKIGTSASATTVLVLSLPEKTSTLKFENTYYAADYIENTTTSSQATIKFAADSIKITGANDNEITFTFEGYEDNFKMVYDSASSSFNIIVNTNLDISTLNSEQLIITITAVKTGTSVSTTTVLVLSLPEKTSTLNFENTYYAADYIENTTTSSQATIKFAADSIKITGANDNEITFKFEGYEDNFKMVYDSASSSFNIIVNTNLDISTLNSEQLIITITAVKIGTSASATTVLVLSLPEKTSTLKFENTYYAADYIENTTTSSQATIKFAADRIKITGANDNEITFTFEGYEDNFKMVYDSASSSFNIIVNTNLDISTLNSEQLIITITAVKTGTSVSATTVLVLSLPEKTSTLNFENTYYAADYIENTTTSSQATIKFAADSIKITGANDNEITFTFEGYEDNFKMVYDSASSTFNIIVNTNLDISTLNSEQLIITITAVKTGTSVSATTVLVLSLPEKTSTLNFKNTYYAADYIENTTTSSQATIKFAADSIKITGANDNEITFTFEGYEDNFKMVYDSASSSFNIIVNTNLDISTLNSEQLIITITAVKTGTSVSATTVLVLSLPEKTSTLNFENTYYAADYIENTTTSSQATIKFAADSIKITGANDNEITFTFEGYEDNFKMVYDSASSSFNIIVNTNLDISTLNSEQLIITITAVKTGTSASATTVLVLSLPEKTSTLNFENTYYAAEYIVNTSSQPVVKFSADSIKVTGANYDKITFNFEGFDDNFELKYDSASSSYDINVKKKLDPNVLYNNTQLVITITADTTDAKSTTVLVLKMPEISIEFQDQHYTADYIVISQSEATVQLDKNIAITNSGLLPVQFLLEGYEDTFDLKFNSTSSTYYVDVTQPLDETILSSNTHLVITITVSTNVPSLSASTVLVLRLPADKNSISVFENNYYVATYKQSTSSSTDQIEIDPDIKIKNADFAAISFEGYDENFVGKCDSDTLECTITVKNNLNTTVLSSNTELLVTLTASNEDGSSTGKTLLLINLPSKNSTFTFTKQHYSAVYTIEKADNDKATVQLNDVISFNGADLSELIIVADEYSNQFSFNLIDSKWNIIVNNNLDSQILSNHTELIISLTATKTETKEYSKAALIIKLPDKTTIAFLQPQYSGKYDGEKGLVVLTDPSEIQTTDNNVQITLDSYSENFDVEIGSNSKWTINVKTPLIASVFTESTQLKLIMTMTKIGVEYGKAPLIIKLPDPRFSQGFYIANYSDDDVASISAEDIEVVNVETADIQVNLSQYNEYIYTYLVDSKWVLELNQPLPAEITQKSELLLTTLQAIRKSDNTQLATSTLLIKLPDLNLTDVPTFNQFTFYGQYKNSSDASTVELEDLIGFTTDTVTVSSVVIEEGSSKYSKYFSLNKRTDGNYDVAVSKNLPEDVLSTDTNVVLTLIASSEEGNKGYAALVINLPKTTREVSVQLKDEEILYNGTYENGSFNSPSIILETNSTDDDKITVEIINELELDKKYFTYTYRNKVLSINVDDLPDDILKKYSVIPLKLAITDKDTGDTVHAVLNVNINYNSGDNGDDDDDSSDGSRVGLLVAVIILALLLVAVIVATILLWYFKIRNTKYFKMEDEEVEKPATKPHPFTKNLTRQTSTPVSSDSSLRRPTGIPIGFIKSDGSTEEASSDFEVPPVSIAITPENEKKVVFDDHVQNIDEHETEYEEPSDNLQNVADRRPTQFVFTYPMEAVLDSPTDADGDERRESSDYEGYYPEKKKSVLFDENIERMDIDVDDQNDEDNEENDESDVNENKNTESYDISKQDDLKKFKSQLEVKLEEQLPNEIYKETP